MTAPTPFANPAPMPTPFSPVTAIPGGQAGRRYQDTFFDIHRHPTKFPAGRPWTGPRELAAMPDRIPKEPDPFCGGDLQQGEYVVDEGGINNRAETFASVWTAPWVPIKKYFKFVYERKLIRFGYQEMYLDEQRGLRDYYAAAAKVGVGFGQGVEFGKIPHPSITNLLGMPSRMIYIAQAAMANDAWLLGFKDEPNEALAEILGLSRDGLPLPPLDWSPVVTTQQVLATPQADLMAMIEQLQAQVAELTAKKAKQRENGKKGAAAAAKARQASVPAD